MRSPAREKAVEMEFTLRNAELVTLIITLRRKGWTDSEIVNFLLEIAGAPQEPTK